MRPGTKLSDVSYNFKLYDLLWLLHPYSDGRGITYFYSTTMGTDLYLTNIYTVNKPQENKQEEASYLEHRRVQGVLCSKRRGRQRKHRHRLSSVVRHHRLLKNKLKMHFVFESRNNTITQKDIILR